MIVKHSAGEMRHFHCKFEIKDLHDDDKDGRIGRFEGFASTFGNTDQMGDIFERGAFADTIADFKARGRPIRMLSEHDRDNLIGGFPADKIFENDQGLFVQGEISRGTQKGREVLSLMKDGFLTDMSIGFFVDDFEIQGDKRIFKKVTLVEISVVGEPANRAAQITAVKSVVPFQDLPLADIDMRWDSTAALGRVRELTGSEDEPSDTFKEAFLFYDRENGDQFGAYKLPIADVVNGRLTAVPRGIFAAAAALQGARGGVNIPDADRPGIIANLERYFDKMGRESPFDKGFGAEELMAQSRGDCVEFLRSGPPLSKSGAEYLVAGIKGGAVKQAAHKQADGLRHLSKTLKELKAGAIENGRRSTRAKRGPG